MKIKTINLILGTLAITAIMSLLSGCSSTTTPVNIALTHTSVEPIVTNILTSLNNNDYVGFSQNFSQTMKNAINQSAFDKLYSQMQSDVGDYQSDYILQCGQQSRFDESGLFRAIFQRTGWCFSVFVCAIGQRRLSGAGLVFTSPNLAGKPIDVSQLRAYADAKIGNAVVSLQNNDYAGFTEDFNQEMKNAMTQSAFTKLYNLISSTVGDYQSKV